MLALPFLVRADSAPAALYRPLPRPAVAATHSRRKPSTTHLPWAPYHESVKHVSLSSPSLRTKATSARPRRVMSTVLCATLVIAFLLLCSSTGGTPSTMMVTPTTARARMSGGAMGRSIRKREGGGQYEYGSIRSPTANPPRPIKPLRSFASPRPTDSSYIPLAPQEELASLIDFLVSSPSHSLPLDTDPSIPLAPDLILDVSLPADQTRRATVLAELGQECWDRWPVIIVGSRKATSETRLLLKHESLLGVGGHGMGYLETNSRPDAPLLLSILKRLTSIPTSSPLVLIGGLPYSLNEFNGIYADGWLGQLLVQAGATLGVQQREREEKERLMKIAMQKIKAARLEDEEEDDEEWY